MSTYEEARIVAARERFLTKFTVTEDGHWLWDSYVHKSGYGITSDLLDDRLVGAHQKAWKLFVGPLEPGDELHHKCEVKLCVNPDHLLKTDHRGNMQFEIGKRSGCKKDLHGPEDANVHGGCRACKQQYMKEYNARRNNRG